MHCSCGNQIINDNIMNKNINDIMCCSCGNKIININNDDYIKNYLNKNLFKNKDKDELFESSPIPMHVTFKKKK